MRLRVSLSNHAQPERVPQRGWDKPVGAISITTGSDARPQVNTGTRSIATGDEDEMDDLDVQRVQVVLRGRRKPRGGPGVSP